MRGIVLAVYAAAAVVALVAALWLPALLLTGALAMRATFHRRLAPGSPAHTRVQS
jgi:hypothetical protein